MNSPLEVPEVICEFPEALKPLRERILANLVMIAQMPSPTDLETARVRFLLDRFAEAGLADAGADEVGNAVGRLVGKRSDRAILLASHLDTIMPAVQRHEVMVESERVLGPGIGDNALGAAVVSLLPAILEHLGLELHSDLILLGSVGALGHGKHAGLGFFLDHVPYRVDFGICVEGMELGRVNYFSIGTARADISCSVRAQSPPSPSYGSESALVVLNHIINRILGIATPARPYTRINMGKMSAGVSYDVEPEHAELGLEIVSHSDEMLDQVCQQIHDIAGEMSARHAMDVNFDVFHSTQAGGIPFSHPLVKSVLEVMRQLDIEPDQGHSPSELSELIRRGIPAVTLGISRGRQARKLEPDQVMIDPILTGVAQLVGVVLAIDEGVCDAV